MFCGAQQEQSMNALILYVLFVTIGALISIGIGYYVEIEFSSTASLIVFLALFFANFAVSWLAVISVIDGTLEDAQGRRRSSISRNNALAARAAAKKIIASLDKMGLVFGHPRASPLSFPRPDHLDLDPIS
jgi:hypothetical protein